MAHRSINVTNVAASVRSRLTTLSAQQGQHLHDLILLYTLEGFLRRVAQSPHAEQLVLKGGLLLFSMSAALGRTTRDLDLMGVHLRIDPAAVADLIRELCTQPLAEDDGLRFDPDNIETEIILEEGDYQGVRAKLYAYLGRARSRVIIDIAAGDPIVPGPRELSFPTLLSKESLTIKAYSVESLIAEKFHALALRGLRTSRLKDCYDLWALSREHPFDGGLLQQAIQATFAARDLAFTPNLPIILTLAFAEDEQKQQQWAAFRTGKNAAAAPASLAEALAPVITFLKPLWEASADGHTFSGAWDAANGIWREITESQPSAETSLVPEPTESLPSAEEQPSPEPEEPAAH
ncbi:MAG TPA: nucleotidyl transferase AbiEii/AbiGii toxin family protein [Ktedonobacterales bacterium]|nr:nucleotidyl transferase AbiEii/AbiGii toxin family protein [Ktedonobacterales bacterium]